MQAMQTTAQGGTVKKNALKPNPIIKIDATKQVNAGSAKQLHDKNLAMFLSYDR